MRATPSSGSAIVQAGTVVEGRYQIIKTIGEGGMGTVYLAEHVLIKRRVALKLLRPELATDPTVVERFMNEARAAGTLGHPNIVESTDMGFTKDAVPYIVFEYLEGALLTDEIYRVKGLPPRRALRIAAQIASALHAAHSAGIIHRDLKSDNIFLTDRDDASDHVKVLDFGISRFLEAEDDRSNTTMGTPEFMAPEQITNPESVDGRADVFALGVVLFEMLAARRPFINADEANLPPRIRVERQLQRIATGDPPTLNRPDAPPGLEQLILERLLAKNPADRFQSMKDVQAAFEAFAGVSRRDSQPILPANYRADGPPSATVIELPAGKRRQLGWLWLAAAAVLGLAGAATMALDQPGTTSDAAGPDLKPDADRIAATLDSELHAAHLRADGIATAPMVRAAIETDAATLHDMAATEHLVKLEPGEALEFFQLRDGKSVSVLRMPETATATAVGPSGSGVVASGNAIAILASAPITKQQGVVGGSITVVLPVDLSAIQRGLTGHVLQATLVGLDRPVVLFGAPQPPEGQAVRLPIQLGPDAKLPGLALNAVVETPVASQAGGASFAKLRYVMWGFGGILLLFYVANLLRKRPQG